MDEERFKMQLMFLTEADKMKNVLRQTLIADGSRRETDAEHSWHFALMAMVLYEYRQDPAVDLDRVVKMALVHDLVEIYAGDTFAYDEQGALDKTERETAAADKLFALLPPDQGGEYRALWEEFDAMETPDSVYANAIDAFQPFWNNCLTNGHTWQLGNGVTASQVYRRMERVKRGLPGLYPFVDGKIREFIAKGRLRRD